MPVDVAGGPRRLVAEYMTKRTQFGCDGAAGVVFLAETPKDLEAAWLVWVARAGIS